MRLCVSPHFFALAAALALILGLAPTASLAWRYEIEGQFERVTAVAVDSLGDVFAVGQGGGGLRVVKLSGATGEELWRVELDPPPNFFRAGVTVDDSDNPIVTGHGPEDVRKFDGATGTLLWAGFGAGAEAVIAFSADDDLNIAGVGPGGEFAVARLSAATGEQLWLTTIVGPRMARDEAHDVTEDAAGDVFAAGRLEDFVGDQGTDLIFTVVKLSGATGEELWIQLLDSTTLPASSGDFANFVTTDAAGDVIAAGNFGGPIHVKYSGATGEEIWRRIPIVGVSMTDAQGNLIGGGLTDSVFTLAKYSSATGDLISQTDIPIPPPTPAVGSRWTLDDTGDVVGAGTTSQPGCIDFTMLKLSVSMEQEIWRETIPSCGSNAWGATSVAVDAVGDVIAGGTIGTIDAIFAVVKLNGSDGTDFLPEPGGTATLATGVVVLAGLYRRRRHSVER
jgi:outer membrane protein assembly factor BamB